MKKQKTTNWTVSFRYKTSPYWEKTLGNFVFDSIVVTAPSRAMARVEARRVCKELHNIHRIGITSISKINI